MSQHSVPSPRVAGRSTGRWSDRAGEMRAEFDGAFARTPALAENDLEDVLALRIGGEPCVLRLREIAGVIAQPLLTVVPTPAPALLGIIGNRGSVVAAYDLGVLRGGNPALPCWLVIAAAEPTVGIGFEHFDGYRRIHRGTPEAGRLIEMDTLLAAIRVLGRQNMSAAVLSPDREIER